MFYLEDVSDSTLDHLTLANDVLESVEEWQLDHYHLLQAAETLKQNLEGIEKTHSALENQLEDYQEEWLSLGDKEPQPTSLRETLKKSLYLS